MKRSVAVKTQGAGVKVKKKKRKSEAVHHVSGHVDSLPVEVRDPPNQKPGRLFTVSVAVPGSILESSPSPELKTYVAGQVARALSIFSIDEIVIFNESPQHRATDGLFRGATKASDPNVLFARILQYLECPHYLRKFFFPVHPDLRYAGLLNPLDSPHHMRIDDLVPYREGVVLDRPVKEGRGSFVNVGMRKELMIDKQLKAGLRVTVKLDPMSEELIASKKYITGTVVPPSAPRQESGIYWGYAVRLARSFGSVFTQCPYAGGYDLTIGTSEKGKPVDELPSLSFRHLLVVFGGMQGLEACLDADEQMKENDASAIFDHYVNTCPNQGSRNIRTEESVFITLATLQTMIRKSTQPP